MGLDGGLWITPGGGIETGESHREALCRELVEETGFLPEGIGPEIRTRTAHLPEGTRKGRVDHNYLVRTR